MGAGEAEALRGAIDAMDLQPAVFDSLADDDEGHDPSKLETARLRDRFDRHEIYASLAAEVEEVANVFSDTALAMGALVKPMALAGYEITRTLPAFFPFRADQPRGQTTVGCRRTAHAGFRPGRSDHWSDCACHDEGTEQTRETANRTVTDATQLTRLTRAPRSQPSAPRRRSFLRI
ncbi:MAG TPA: hypothetical protein VF469_07595 [Kofleriaceae bacterium]